MDDEVYIPKEQFDTLLLRAQVELLQRVNRLVEILEKEYGERKEGKPNETTSVVETST